MKETVKSLFVGALALAVSVAPVTPIGAQERSRGNQAAEAVLSAQRAATAESILAAKEQARGESFDASIRAGLKSRMETLSLEQLASLAQQGADADIPLALGSVTSDLVYTPVTPCRLFDSRVSQGGPGPIAANSQWNVFVAGSANFFAQGGTPMGCSVPIGATSAIINFVTVLPAGPGNIRAWAVTPGGMQLPAPLAAVLNYGVVTGLPAIANGVAVPLCNPAAGSCAADLRLQADTSGTDILGDVVGYFRNPQGLGTVPGTTANTVFASGYGANGGGLDPTGALDFVGATADVTVTATQKIAIWANKALGSTTGAGSLNLYTCRRPTMGALNQDGGGGLFGLTAAAGERKIFSMHSVIGPLTAGTYTVGMCGSSAAPAAWNNNEFSYLVVQVLNP